MPSYSQPDRFTQLRGQLDRSGAPFTLCVAAGCALLFLVDYFSHHLVTKWLPCLFVMSHIVNPWGVLTFPLINPDFVTLLFAGYFFFMIGSSMERSWGTRRFALFTAASTIITALSVWLGCTLLHSFYVLYGLWIAIPPIVIAWAVLNPRQTILFSMIVPVPAYVLAAITVGIVYFEAFKDQIGLGLFGLIPCALAFFYANGNFGFSSLGNARRGPDLRMSRSGSGGRRGPSVLDGSRPAAGGPMGWIRAWQERRRLRKLWRDSGFGD